MYSISFLLNYRASGPLNTGANFFFEIKIMNEGQNKEIAVGVSGRSCDLGKIHPLHIELSLIVYTPLEIVSNFVN